MEVPRLALACVGSMALAAPLWAAQSEAPTGEPPAMPTVTVRATAEQHVDRNQAALRQGIDPMDTPATTHTLDADGLQRQGVRTLTDSLSLVPGMTDTGTEWTLTMRGFSANVMKNGMLDASPLAIQMVPLIGVERIEVVKGPEAIVAGQSAGYGGVVNVVTKQAQPRRSAEVELTSGSNGRHGLGVDLGGALTDDARWSGRMVAASDRERPDSMGYLGPHQTYAAASLAFRDKAMGTALHLSHEHNEQGLKNFWMVYYDPLTTRLGHKGNPLRLGDNANRIAQVLTQTTRADWTQQLNSDWQVSLRWQRQATDFRLTGGLLGLVTAYPAVLGVGAAGRDERHTNSLKLDLRGAFDTGAFRHQMVLALDSEQGSAVKAQARPNDTGLYSALTGQLVRPVASAGPLATVSDYTYRETGALLMDHISWGKWVAMVGVRRVGYRPVNRMEQVAESYRATLPSLGLVFRASDTLSWYGNTAKAFRANTGLMEFATGQQVKPESARQWELGLKHQSSDAPLNWNIATYRIAQRNRAVTDTAHTTGPQAYYLSADGVSSKGVEAALTGNLAARMRVGATYAFGTVTTPAGQPPVPFARHIWGLNAAYDLQQPGQGPWVGASLYGRSAAHILDTRLNLDTVSPGVFQLDVSGGYRSAGWALVLGVKNLTNRRNYTLTSGPNGTGFLLQPRQVYASLNFRI